MRALENAVRFSDPPETVLEENDVAVLLRADSLDSIADGANALFEELDGMFRVTSIRRGSPAAASTARGACPSRWRWPPVSRAPISFPRPRSSSSASSTKGRPRPDAKIANFETLGYVDLRASKYFQHGTNMHVSHLFEDLEAWYLNFDHRERVDTTFRPGLDVPVQTLTVPQGTDDIQTQADVSADYEATRRIGHSGAIQQSSRLTEDVERARRDALQGHGDPAPCRLQHARQPVLLDGASRAGPLRPRAAAGLHFVVFNPSSDDFRRNRLAMDGILPDGTVLPFEPRSRGAGLQRRSPDDASPELPRAAARAPFVPAGGTADRLSPQNGHGERHVGPPSPLSGRLAPSYTSTRRRLL